MRTPLVLLCVALATISCGPGSREDAPRAKVVVFQDGSVPDALSVVSPAVLGLGLALEGSPIAIQVVDVNDAGQVALVGPDTEVVGVVVAPFSAAPTATIAELLGRGVPVLSVSEVGPADRTGLWRRLVPPLQVQASALATAARAGPSRSNVCVAGDASAWSTTLSREVEDKLGHALARATGLPSATTCQSVVWTGFAPGLLSMLASPGGVPQPLWVGDAARLDSVLPRASGEDTLGVCGCVDLTVRARADGRAFVHDLQAATGLDPGPFAAEGFDAGRILFSAVTDHTELPDVYHGLAGTYRWGSEGELVQPLIHWFAAPGVRWVPTATAPGA